MNDGKGPLRGARTLRQKAARLVDRFFDRFGVAVVVLSFVYLVGLEGRVALWLRYDQGNLDVHPFNFNTTAVSLWGFLGCGNHDLAWAGVAALVVAFFEFFAGKRVAVAAGALAVLLTAIVIGTHIELVFAMHTGFSWVALMEFWSSPAVGQISSFIRPLALLGLIAFTGLFVFCATGHGRRRRIALATATVTLIVVTIFAHTIAAPRVKPPLKENACVFLAGEVAKNAFRTSKFERASPLSAAQLTSLAFIDPVFHAGVPGETLPAPLVRTTLPAPKNVLFIVLESTGYEYLLTRRPDGRPLMPALAARAEGGVWFENHRSSGNSSASSLFSIFTGLYPVPEQVIYAIKSEATLPALPSLLSRELDTFLITPGELESFFPRSLLRHAGLSEMWGYYNLPEENRGTVQTPANRDERTVAAFVGQRLAAAKTPFFGVYYTYAPHFDYDDYGEEYRVFTDEPKSKKTKYLNNLVMVDTLLDKLFRQLEQAGRLSDTLVVVVGDHGEAFGQHKRNFGHSRASWEENLRTPLLLLHPSLQAGRVTVATSHVDIAPTILELLGAPPVAVEGRSLLQPLPPRRLFGWGNQGHMTTWSGPGNTKKTRISVLSDGCRVWDLAKDPREEVAGVACSASDTDDVEALVAWRTHSRVVLKAHATLPAALPTPTLTPPSP